MANALTQEEQWAKLKIWLHESIEAVERGDLERLPASFTGEQGAAAVEAYKTCQQAMHFLENWQQFGLPRHNGG